MNVAVIMFVLMVFLWGRETRGEFFDCNRDGQDCKHGTCAEGGQSCICDAGYSHPPGIEHLCVPYEILDDPCQTDNCQNNNYTCLRDTAGEFQQNRDICFCHHSFAGDTCQYQRLAVECNGMNMGVTIRPYGDFYGVIQAAYGQNTSNCSFPQTSYDTSSYWPQSVHQKTLPINTCGMVYERLSNGDFKYSLNIVVHYSANRIFMENDQMLKAICIYPQLVQVNASVYVKAAPPTTTTKRPPPSSGSPSLFHFGSLLSYWFILWLFPRLLC